MLLRTLTGIAAPAGRRGRLSVFYFHRVLAQPDPLLPYEPDARMFARILGWIGAQFRVLDPLEACERLYEGTLPARPAVITFDDGYRDNYTVALPVLKQHRMRAAFFVATGFLGGSMMFNDRVIEAVRKCRGDAVQLPGTSEALAIGTTADKQQAIERILRAIKHLSPEVRDERVRELEQAVGVLTLPGMMMDPDQVLALQNAGMQVGGHTRTHPILCSLDEANAQAEISGGADDLAAILGQRPRLFAYPNGRYGADFDDRHPSMVERAGFRYAFTTHAGAADASYPSMMLPRFTPWDRTPLRFGLRAWRNLLQQNWAWR